MAIHEDQPLKGWYKFRRHKDAKWEPACIFENDGKLVCRVAERMEDPHALWTYLAGNKVEKDAAQFAFKNGYFPDEPPPIGHNNAPPPSDPYEALKAEIEAKQEQAVKWLGSRPTITMQADADYATNAQRQLLALNKRADAMFKAEKQPHLDACRTCDDRYSFRRVVAEVAEGLRRVYGRFMAAEEARLQASAAAKLKAEQEALAQRLVDDPVAALTDPAPQLALEPVTVQAGGGIGRRAGLRDVWIGTITDYREAAIYFLEHPKLKEVVDNLVQHQVRDLKSSAKIPGVTISKERRAA